MNAPVKDAQTLASHNQRRAAAPETSAWVSANAGSGKTRVLVHRVTNLLLAGARPNGILCLTFTKAAAAEMSKRLGHTLGRWAVIAEDDLRAALADQLGRAPNDAEMTRARSLFAHALDVPGGLNIKTIHSFCESLLKRFPLEAQVPAHFTVADERATRAMIDQALRDLMTEIGGWGEDDPRTHDFHELALGLGEESFAACILDAMRKRLGLRRLAERAQGNWMAQTLAALGLPADATADGLRADYCAGINRDTWRAHAAILAKGSKTDGDRADLIYQFCETEDFDAWRAAFLTADGTIRKTLMTKEPAQAHPHVLEALQQEAARLLRHMNDWRAARIAVQSATFADLAARAVELFEAAKTRRGLLDFDDMILKTAALLENASLAPWVLYKLDQGLDHILVDEAQDTSPDQWAVIAALAEEFFAGQSAREDILPPRSLFVVGDDKQSIFAFQGADARAFAQMRDRFARLIQNVERPWAAIDLGVSFRSAPAVLRAVDAVFAQPLAARGVGEGVAHRAARDFPGLVELWPAFENEESPEAEGWQAPLDQLSETSAKAKMADAIADRIQSWLNAREALYPGGPAIRAGDIMILVRKRGAFFHRMVKTLKARGLPLAGVDRMALLEDIGVMDLLALGDFLLLPDDDYALACVLKSPLYGLDDEDLFALRHGETRRLWRALDARADERPHWRVAATELAALMAEADYLRPYELYATLLGPRGGRARMLARLGEEAREALDEFLNLALAFEREEAGGLQGFLQWLRNAGGEIKRELDEARNEIRIMTVHGSKGLEAPIVFLPDTFGAAVPNSKGPALFWLMDGQAREKALLIGGSSRDDNDERAALRAAHRAAQEEEHARLLYVAMTRAAQRLYVGGFKSSKNSKEPCWHDHVTAGLATLEDIERFAMDHGEGLRLSDAGFVEGTAGAAPGEAARAAAASLAPPAHLRAPAPFEPTPPKPLAPSRALAEQSAAASPMAQDGARFERGRIIHRLLEFLPDLPAPKRDRAARAWLGQPAHGLSEADQAAIAQEVMALFNDPALAPLWEGESRNEAPITGQVGSHVLSGQIDRLVIGADHVWVLDYKSNRPGAQTLAEVDPSYILQMALYRALLRPLFPGRTVQCGLLWTYDARLMILPDDILDQALA